MAPSSVLRPTVRLCGLVFLSSQSNGAFGISSIWLFMCSCSIFWCIVFSTILESFLRQTALCAVHPNQWLILHFVWHWTGISRDSFHKRRATGGKRKQLRKKRKFELGRPAANTKVIIQSKARIQPFARPTWLWLFMMILFACQRSLIPWRLQPLLEFLQLT